jgi:hypothetical protein
VAVVKIMAEMGLRPRKSWEYLGDISGYHGGEYEDDCLLGCCAMKSGRSLPTFRFYLDRQVPTSQTNSLCVAYSSL